MYLHKIINMKERRLVKQVYEEQKRLSFVGCWYNQIMEDLKSLNIDLTEKQIGNLTNKEWKKLINQNIITSIGNDVSK